MGLFRFIDNAITNRQVKTRPLDTILERTSLFLNPQIRAMEEFEGNKFAFINLQSMLYIVFIAEEIGGRIILEEERDRLFFIILGEEYKKRVDFIFEPIKDRTIDADEFEMMIKEIKKIARSDVQKRSFALQ